MKHLLQGIPLADGSCRSYICFADMQSMCVINTLFHFLVQPMQPLRGHYLHGCFFKTLVFILAGAIKEAATFK